MACSVVDWSNVLPSNSISRKHCRNVPMLAGFHDLELPKKIMHHLLIKVWFQDSFQGDWRFLYFQGAKKKTSLLHLWQANPCTVASCKEPWMASSPEAWAKPVAFLPSALAAGPRHHQTDASSCTWPALGRLLHGCFLQTALIWRTFSQSEILKKPTINNHNAEIDTD